MQQDDPYEATTSQWLRPTRLVYSDDNGKLKIDPDAIDALDPVEGRLAVVSVCGHDYQRTCFLLNQLVGKSTGVQVSSTHLPCTKGLWMWGAPLKRTAPDGTEYNLLLLNCEEMDAYDATGTNCSQLLSLAILLSGVVVYSQISDVSEDSLDHLVHATEISKHIREKSSSEKDPVPQLGSISPVFIWLMDLNLKKGNTKITPHDYLELALRPLIGGGEDIAARNKVRASIRAFFPERECFSLVCPSRNDTGLELPDFGSSIDALTKFIFERTEHKQVEDIMMTGPVFCCLLKSFLDTLNDGAAITLLSSWQDYKRNSFLEEDLPCINAIENMKKKVHASCLVADANIEDVVKVIDGLQSEYEASINGPEKWQKLSSFLRKSLQGPILQHAKKAIDKVSSEKAALLLKCYSAEDKMDLLCKKLEATEKLKNDYQKHYEDSIVDLKKLSDRFANRITDLESKCRLLEDRCYSSLEMLDSAKQESFEWKRKYEDTFTLRGAFDYHSHEKTSDLMSRIREVEAKAAVATQQAQLALKERDEWRKKYTAAAQEAEADAMKEAMVQEFSNEKAKLREETLMGEHHKILAQKDEEIKDKEAKLAEAEQKLATVILSLKDSQTKIKNYETEVSALKLQVKESDDRYEYVRAAAPSVERDSETLNKLKTELEQKYLTDLNSYEKACEKACELCTTAEEKIKVANELVKSARSVVQTTRDEKSEARWLARERLVQIENLQMHIGILEKQKKDLEGDVEKYHVSEGFAASRIAFLDTLVKDKDQEIKSMKIKIDQQSRSVQVLDSSLEHESVAHRETSGVERSPDLQLHLHQANIGSSHQESPSVHTNDSSFNSNLSSYSLGKQWWRRTPASNEDLASATKKLKTTTTIERCSMTEDANFVVNTNEDTDYGSQNAYLDDYMKLTVVKLREALVEHGFGAELRALKNPKKKNILDLYKKLVLKQ